MMMTDRSSRAISPSAAIGGDDRGDGYDEGGEGGGSLLDDTGGGLGLGLGFTDQQSEEEEAFHHHHRTAGSSVDVESASLV